LRPSPLHSLAFLLPGLELAVEAFNCGQRIFDFAFSGYPELVPLFSKLQGAFLGYEFVKI
jgi:hypothetical protein